MNRKPVQNATAATPYPLAPGEVTRIVETWGMYQVNGKGAILSGMLATGVVPSEVRDMEKAAVLFHMKALDKFHFQRQVAGQSGPVILDAKGQRLPSRKGFGPS